MKLAFPALLALALVGCTPSSTADPAASTGSGDQTGTAKPDANLNSGTANTTTPLPGSKPPKDTKTDPEPAQPKLDNPSRLHQLKDLKKADLTAAGQTVHAWIMDDESKRQEGMMFLVDKDVKEDQGMIFLFPDLQLIGGNKGFWMHNCPMGLDIVYVGPDKKVVNVGDGKPEDDNSVPALNNYQYVLELKRGWSKRHGLKKGDPIGIPTSLKTTE